MPSKCKAQEISSWALCEMYVVSVGLPPCRKSMSYGDEAEQKNQGGICWEGGQPSLFSQISDPMQNWPAEVRAL